MGAFGTGRRAVLMQCHRDSTHLTAVDSANGGKSSETENRSCCRGEEEMGQRWRGCGAKRGALSAGDAQSACKLMVISHRERDLMKERRENYWSSGLE